MSNVLAFSVSADSTRQLMRNLHVLPRAVQKRQLLKALNAAGGVGKTAALARVAVETGLLKKSLVVKTINDKQTRSPIGVMVGPSRKVFRNVFGGKAITANKSKKLIAKGVKLKLRRPSRYAHLAEKKHPAIAAADSALRNAGFVKMQDKLRQGIEEERAKLPVK